MVETPPHAGPPVSPHPTYGQARVGQAPVAIWNQVTARVSTAGKSAHAAQLRLMCRSLPAGAGRLRTGRRLGSADPRAQNGPYTLTGCGKCSEPRSWWDVNAALCPFGRRPTVCLSCAEPSGRDGSLFLPRHGSASGLD